MSNATLGLDIGGTEIKAIAMTSNGSILEKTSVPSHAAESPQAVRTAIRECVQYFQLRGIQFSAIGIGCAGSVDSTSGTVRNSPNFSHWKNVPLSTWVTDDFKVKTVVENDANCAVFSEWKLGAGVGAKNVVMLTLGTGIGGGLVLNNQLFTGSTGTGGELGHFSIYANGIDCPCGNRGCFERYCSASAVTSLTKGKSCREIFETVETIPSHKKIVEDFIENFQVGLVSISNVFDPDVILLGGAVSKGLLPYQDRLQKWLSTHAFPAVGAHVKIQQTKFGNLSGAMGAALLALD